MENLKKELELTNVADLAKSNADVESKTQQISNLKEQVEHLRQELQSQRNLTSEITKQVTTEMAKSSSNKPPITQTFTGQHGK